MYYRVFFVYHFEYVLISMGRFCCHLCTCEFFKAAVIVNFANPMPKG